MTFHGFLSPRDMPDLSYWRDYICDQAVGASLGLIPVHALSLCVRFEDMDRKITLEYQLTEAAEEDVEDMEEIFDQFGEQTGGDLMNPPFTISWTYEIVDKTHGVDHSQVRPIYVRNHRIMPDTDPNMKNAWISLPRE